MSFIQLSRDNISNQQEIFMYDIISKTVSRLSGELSSKFVDVAEENATAQDEDGNPIASPNKTVEIDRIDENIESDQEFDDDQDEAASEVVESVVKFDSSPITPENETPNKVSISSGYSSIKNE